MEIYSFYLWPSAILLFKVQEISVDIYIWYMYYKGEANMMKRISYHLTENQIKALKARSKETGLAVAELIRRRLMLISKSDL